MEIKRVPTGIPGFDQLISSGLVHGSATIITGGPGVGKTTFCMQFLYNGLTLYDETAVYVTLEENPQRLLTGCKQIGMDFQPYVDSGKFAVVSFAARDTTAQEIADLTVETIRQLNAKRLVIDSLNLLMLVTGEETDRDVRVKMINLIEKLRGMGCTTLFTHERRDLAYSSFDFVCDGLIHMQLLRDEATFKTALRVVKMRYTPMDNRMILYSITPRGIKVYPDANVFGSEDSFA